MARSSQGTHIRSLLLALEFRFVPFVFSVPYERIVRPRGRLWLFSDKFLGEATRFSKFLHLLYAM
jgi:hypothetical protein